MNVYFLSCVTRLPWLTASGIDRKLSKPASSCSDLTCDWCACSTVSRFFQMSQNLLTSLPESKPSHQQQRLLEWKTVAVNEKQPRSSLELTLVSSWWSSSDFRRHELLPRGQLKVPSSDFSYVNVSLLGNNKKSSKQFSICGKGNDLVVPCLYFHFLRCRAESVYLQPRQRIPEINFVSVNSRGYKVFHAAPSHFCGIQKMIRGLFWQNNTSCDV